MTANQAEPVRGATDSRPRWRTPKYLAALLVVGAPVMVRAVCDATLPEQKTPNSSGRRLDVRPGVPFPGCVYGQGNVASTPYPSITAAANCAGAGDTIYVHQGTYYGQQSIVGRSGTASAWIVVTSAPGEIGPKLRGTGINNRGVGVLQVENSSYIAIGPGFDVGVADARGINVVASSAAVHHVIVFGNSVHDNTDAGIVRNPPRPDDQRRRRISQQPAEQRNHQRAARAEQPDMPGRALVWTEFVAGLDQYGAILGTVMRSRQRQHGHQQLW